MKSILSLILFFLSISAAAQTQTLVKLSCSGANGLKLALDAQSDIVMTQLGPYKKKFESNRIVFLYEAGKTQVTRLALGIVNASSVYVYDIYLKGHPTAGQPNKMTGVIGHTVNSVVLTPIGAPVPLPYGFVPTTNLNCLISTK